MAAFYTSIVSTRTTDPDVNSLLATLRSSVDSTIGIQASPGVFTYTLKKSTTDWTATDIANATTAINNAAPQTLDSIAQSTIDHFPVFEKAIALTLLDEINLLREWIASFKAAVAASTSLANLQTRVAALPDMPDRTVQQAIQAVRTKAGAL